MPNHLAGESSPYLLQHAENPVEWYPWSEDAFRRAREEDRPIFLSIGYSACHWCHVMAHESFNDPAVAEFLNAHFVSIKVDREERPELDTIYLQAVTSLTGQGGWPLSVWLTPEGAPFYGGTYFPPLPRFGRPSFRQVLEAVMSTWHERRADLRAGAGRIVEQLRLDDGRRHRAAPRGGLLDAATASLAASFDPAHGGWGEAPKFPQPLVLEYLLARQTVSPQAQVEAHVRTTLDAMAAGGIYDQLGGGFHRYATDEAWLVPHFEKMLYDNAQLARCYLHAWQWTGEPRYRAVVEETLDYLLRRMNHPRGGFFSAEDADSEGREGAFYVWTLEQMREVLAPDEVAAASTVYGVTDGGNFEGANILYLPGGAGQAGSSLPEIRAKLLAARDGRVPPARDDKVLSAWNGLALAAFSEAARVLRSDRHLQAALKNGEFLVGQLVHDGNRLAHSWMEGRVSGNGLLEDYACVAEGLLALYQTTFAERWYLAARELADAMIEFFRRSSGGFYDTSCDHERLIIRPRAVQDSPTPSGNALAATVLLKMAAYSGERGYQELAEQALESAGEIVTRAPVVAGQWLTAHLLAETGLTQVAVVGDTSSSGFSGLLETVDSAFRPTLVAAARQAGVASQVPILIDREPAAGAEAAAWVCRASTCHAPTSDPVRLATILG